MQKSRTFGVDRTSAWLGRVAYSTSVGPGRVSYCTSVQLGGVGYCTSAQLGTRVELGLDECEGGLSWRQSPASVAKGSIVHSYTSVRLKEAHTQKSGS